MRKNQLLLAGLLFLLLPLSSGQTQILKQELKAINFNEEDTRYSFDNQDDQLVIDAMGVNSASGLFVPQPELCLDDDFLSWAWKVDTLQTTADITDEEKEDFGASLIVLFGKPGLFSKPKGLIYAFANTDLPVGSVVESPRAPDNFRTIVLDNSQSPLMNWRDYKRNIIEDYKVAYGEAPTKKLHTIGIFTDNDQTQEPVKASYALKSCNLV